MIIQKDRAKYSLLALFLIVLAAAVLITGCGKKETAKEEKHSAIGGEERSRPRRRT